jgi:general secretion pathway protein G
MVKRLLILVVVLALILLVIAILFIPRGFVDYGSKMSIKASIAEIQVISSALEEYKLENGAYPTTEQGLNALLEKPTSPPIPKDWKGSYISDDINDCWNDPYQYRCPSQHNRPDFDLWSFGPDGKDGTKDDLTNWKPTPK